MAQNQLITTRSGIYQFPSFASFPVSGYNKFLYVDQSDGSCYEWDDTNNRYRSLRGGLRQWRNNAQYLVGDVVVADYATFVCVITHTSLASGTLFDEVGKWRNASSYGRVDVTNVTGSATVTISEMNSSDFNIFVQPDAVTASLVITLPDPAQRTGQTLTYCFSAVPAAATTATVTFNNHTGTAYNYTPSFKIPNASTVHQGIRTIRFVSTAKGNGDSTAMWFPLDEDFRGATDALSGSNGSVPAPLTTDQRKFLSAKGIWDNVRPTARAWAINTALLQGEMFSVGNSIFIATTDTSSGGTSFNADLAAGKPYVWIGGHEYVYALPTTPATITVNVPTLRIVAGTTPGSFVLPTPTGSGRKIRVIREDTTATIINIQDPATSQLYPVHYTSIRETDLIAVDTSSSGWSVDSYGSAQPRVFNDGVITASTTLSVAQKNAIQRVNTASAPITLTLPGSGMTIGDNFQLIDLAGTWGTNNLTITGTIYGAADSYIIDLPKRKVTFVYVDATTGYVME